MSTRRTIRPGTFYAGKDTRTQPNACLDCGKVMDAATGIGHRRKPRPGSISICLDCGHIMAFDWQLKFRPLTDEEVLAIAGDPVVIAAQWARNEYMKAKKAKADVKGEEADGQTTL
jgi:hypothetical protein